MVHLFSRATFRLINIQYMELCIERNDVKCLMPFSTTSYTPIKLSINLFIHRKNIYDK